MSHLTWPINYAERLYDYFGDKEELLRFAEGMRSAGCHYEQWWVCGSYVETTLDWYTRHSGDSITYHFKLLFADEGRRDPNYFHYATTVEYVGIYDLGEFQPIPAGATEGAPMEGATIALGESSMDAAQPAVAIEPTAHDIDDGAIASAPTPIQTTDSIDDAAIATDDAAVAESIAGGL